MYCYIVESLSTTLREYKTLRMCEFYGMMDTILNPKITLELLQKDEEAGDALKHEKESEMKSFVKMFGGMFNSSQRDALAEVTKMVDN